MDGNEPVFRLRDEFEAESYWPEEYVREALPVIEGFGWLARPTTDADAEAASAVLRGLADLSLDETDVFPFGLLWSLRARGVLGEVAGLDEQLAGWRKWEEEDHLAHGDHGPDPLGFLPVLNPPDAWAEAVLRHERERAELDLRQMEELLALASPLGYETRTLQAKANAARARLDGMGAEVAPPDDDVTALRAEILVGWWEVDDAGRDQALARLDRIAARIRR